MLNVAVATHAVINITYETMKIGNRGNRTNHFQFSGMIS